MRLNGVNQTGETPSATEAADAMEALNGMLNAWEGLGIDLEFLGFTDLSQVVPYPDDHISAFAYNLAIELAPEYGVEITAGLSSRAQTYFKMLQAKYCDPDILTIDPTLTPWFNANSSWFR
jgi:hypothetical protein